jgi:regulator of replication initiation timing
VPIGVWLALIAIIPSTLTGITAFYVATIQRSGKHDAIRDDARYLDDRLAESRKREEDLYKRLQLVVEENLRLRFINDKTVVHATELSDALLEFASNGSSKLAPKVTDEQTTTTS